MHAGDSFLSVARRQPLHMQSAPIFAGDGQGIRSQPDSTDDPADRDEFGFTRPGLTPGWHKPQKLNRIASSRVLARPCHGSATLTRTLENRT